MGKSQKHRAAFKLAHPTCCYCGAAPTQTIDHAPARICFARRVGPDGYEFPACEACNRRARKPEQVAAFYIHCLTENTGEFPALVKAMRNNYPELLPRPDTTLTEKARFLAARDVTLPGPLLAALPLVTIPNGVHDQFHFFTAKLAKAIYYKHFQRPAGPNFRIVTHWSNSQQPNVGQFLQPIMNVTPMIEVGSRPNEFIGNQFVYRLNYSPEHEVMVFLASFSERIFLTAICANADFGLDFDGFLTQLAWREPDLNKQP